MWAFEWLGYMGDWAAHFFIINLFKAKHMYTCYVLSEKNVNFFTDMSLEWSQDWIFAYIFVIFFLPKIDA